MTNGTASELAEMDPQWGSEDRDRKAQNILQCLELLTDQDLSTLSCVDIGCGSGGISYHLAPAFDSICGIDPEPWQRWRDFAAAQPHLSFREESIETLSLANDSVDVVICNQVYEHVPDPQMLIMQIHRILKPGGVCYFAGPNLLYPIEPHVFWPFIHWIPRSWALAILRTFSPEKEKVLDAYSTTYWRLKHWLRDFDIVDAVPPLIKHKANDVSSSKLWHFFRPIPVSLLRLFTFLSPGLVFVLRKAENSVLEERSTLL